MTGSTSPTGTATRRGELLVQRCKKCGTFQWGPEWICHKCLSFDLDWHKVSGKGRIYSWERPWHPVHPALKDHGPYIVVLVELPDAGNVRMLGNLLGDPKQEVRIGADGAGGVRAARRRQAALHPGAVEAGLASERGPPGPLMRLVFRTARILRAHTVDDASWSRGPEEHERTRRSALQ